MTYPLFAAEWHLTHTVTTGVFAIYPIVVAAVLVGFGDVSDYIGRRAAILWGVGASLVGTLLFALAPDVLWLFAGRAFMGIGVGLTAGPSTAAMVEFNGQGAAKRAVTITTAAQAVGFAAALLLGGALVQYAPLPTRLNFWALFAVLAALFVAAWFLPRHTGSEAQGRWRPKTPVIPSHLRNVFAVAAAWRTDPVARKSGCSRSRWIAKHTREWCLGRTGRCLAGRGFSESQARRGHRTERCIDAGHRSVVLGGSCGAPNRG
jgi:MFS family permease